MRGKGLLCVVRARGEGGRVGVGEYPIIVSRIRSEVLAKTHGVLDVRERCISLKKLTRCSTCLSSQTKGKRRDCHLPL